jgi:hypothetical protein
VDRAELLNGLLRTKSAGLKSQTLPACAENTRVGILDELKSWSRDPNRESVYWMYGLAGTGKTTIAYSFAEFLESEQRLGASFFCSRAHADRSNVEHIFPFIAHQLAMVDTGFRRALLPALEQNFPAGNLAPKHQIVKLLVQPLKQIAAIEPPLVVVLDALDECQDEKATSEIIALIAPHADVFSRIKLFISSRPETHIVDGFRKGSLTSHTHMFILHDVNRRLIKNDIEIYLRKRLGDIAHHRDEITLDSWPPESLLQALVEKCGGLWIFASTACTLIDDPFDNPCRRLEEVAGVESNVDGHGDIDQLYRNIFDLAFKQLANAKIEDNVKNTLAAVLLLFDPISVSGMAGLLKLDTSDIRRPLKRLASVLILPDNDDGSIQTFHASFHDYLTSEKRCSGLRFYVNPSICHARLALQCLQCLQESRSKICWPEWLEDVPKAAHVQSRLGVDVCYSCYYWMKHLGAGISVMGEVNSEIVTLLGSFFLETLYHWMECMAFLDELNTALSSVKEARLWLDVSNGLCL